MRFVLPTTILGLAATLTTAGVIHPDPIAASRRSNISDSALPAAMHFIEAPLSPSLSRSGSGSGSPGAGLRARRTTTRLLACFDPRWQGRCVAMLAVADQCYNLADLAGEITSVAQDQYPDMWCTLFAEPDCALTGGVGARTFLWPGVQDLRRLGIDDKARSFLCGVHSG